MFKGPFLFLIGCAFCSLGAASDLRIVVTKNKRTLEVFRGAERLHQFRVALGGNPVGDKAQAGDGRTPEGIFYVCVKNPKSRFYLSLGLSYPAPDDAARGLREGLISRREHDRIVAAHERKTTPPWNTGLGGEIFIHGHGSSRDWTLGCVALENEDMKTLFQLIDVGTRVEVRP